MAKKIYKISQYFLSLLRILFVHYLFRKSVPLFNNFSKKQFTLANGCLNLNEWFDLVLP